MISLSPSKLNLFKECPRCFYDSYALKVPRVRGIFPTLPGGLDRVLKSYYDRYRLQAKMPPEIEEHVGDCKLFPDMAKLKKFRHWRTGLTTMLFNNTVKLIGALDDCLVTPEGLHIPFDYKSKGSEPKNDGSQFYQVQLDSYNLMLALNGYPVQDEGFLAYYYPEAVNVSAEFAMELATDVKISFKCKIYKLQCSQERALGIIRKAADLLLGGVRPAANPECGYCSMIESKKGL